MCQPIQASKTNVSSLLDQTMNHLPMMNGPCRERKRQKQSEENWKTLHAKVIAISNNQDTTEPAVPSTTTPFTFPAPSGNHPTMIPLSRDDLSKGLFFLLSLQFDGARRRRRR